MIYALYQQVNGFFWETFVYRFDFWLAFGVVAQLVFTGRFLVQWIVSEKEGRSVMPVSFWILSIIGGTMTLIYGIARYEAVIIMGQALANVIYARNLVLIAREKRAKKR